MPVVRCRAWLWRADQGVEGDAALDLDDAGPLPTGVITSGRSGFIPPAAESVAGRGCRRSRSTASRCGCAALPTCASGSREAAQKQAGVEAEADAAETLLVALSVRSS